MAATINDRAAVRPTNWAGRIGSALLDRILGPISELIRWGEPWDLEMDDPLLDRDHAARATSLDLWS